MGTLREELGPSFWLGCSFLGECCGVSRERRGAVFWKDSGLLHLMPIEGTGEVKLLETSGHLLLTCSASGLSFLHQILEKLLLWVNHSLKYWVWWLIKLMRSLTSWDSLLAKGTENKKNPHT